MKGILAILMASIMMAAMIAPAMGAGTSATVNDAETTFSLSATYTTDTDFGSNGEFTATLVATDANGESGITADSYTVTWTDENGSQEATLNEITDTDPLTKTYEGTGAIPYHQDYNSVLTISGPGISSATVTIDNELKGITAGDVAFPAVNAGDSTSATSTITNSGNVDASIATATPTALSSTGTGGSIDAPDVDTTLPLIIGDLDAGTGTGTVSFTLNVDTGTPAATDYAGTVTFTLTA